MSETTTTTEPVATDVVPEPVAETAITQSVMTDPPVVEGEVKPEPEKAPEAEKPVEEAKPVEYTDFELPEGLSAEDKTLALFREEAGRLGLTQEQAQALVSKIGDQAAQNAAAQAANWVKMNNDWQSEIKADPETGGDKFESMRINVARVFDDYCGPIGSPDRTKLNNELLLTGAGNLPMLVKVFARIAAAHTEGGHVSGNPARAPASTADLLYPTHGQSNPAGSRMNQ